MVCADNKYVMSKCSSEGVGKLKLERKCTMRQNCMTLLLLLSLVLSVGCNAVTIEMGMTELGNDYSSGGMDFWKLSDTGICYGVGVSVWNGKDELRNAASTAAPVGSVALGAQKDEATEFSVFIGKKLGDGYLMGRVSSYSQERGDVFEYTNPVTGDVTYHAPNAGRVGDAAYGIEYVISIDELACSVGWHNERGIILSAGFSY